MMESNPSPPVAAAGAGDIGASDPANPAVVISGISKRYGRVEALTDISFDVKDNEMFALLGPNGAGKTTLILSLIHI